MHAGGGVLRGVALTTFRTEGKDAHRDSLLELRRFRCSLSTTSSFQVTTFCTLTHARPSD